MRIIDSPHERTSCIAVAKQSNQFYTIGSDSEIRIWNLESIICESVFSPPESAQSSEMIKEICSVSNDDKYLFTLSNVGIQVWSLLDQIYLGNIHLSDVTAFTLTADNSCLIIASSNQIFEIVNPTYDLAPVIALTPFEYTFKF